MLAEALATVHAGAAGLVLVRADSAYYGYDITDMGQGAIHTRIGAAVDAAGIPRTRSASRTLWASRPTRSRRVPPHQLPSRDDFRDADERRCTLLGGIGGKAARHWIAAP